MGILFNDIRVHLAEQFLDNISSANDSIYLTFGKVDGWANDAAPPTPNTAFDSYNEIWRNMIGAKKLTGTNISLAIPRNTWAANTIYEEFDQSVPTLYSNSNFYVVTSDWNVYKCLSNSNGANSTIEPTSTNANNVTNTADGYVWKFMYQVRESDRILFMTDAYLPIHELTSDDNSLQWDVQQGAVEGAIFATKVTDGGSGYSNTNNVIVTFAGDGSGATANVTLNTTTNTVNTISMTDFGAGYTNAFATITGGGGSGATAVPLLSPQKGHGYNPVYELGASYLIINIRLENTESGVFSIDNEYRQVALLKNPITYGTSNVSSNTTISQTMDITVSGSGVDYENDEVVYQGDSIASATFTGRILSYDSSNSVVYLINTVGTPTNDQLVGANSTASKFVASVDYPGFDDHTGQLLYMDNFSAISRDADQTEDFKIVIGL